jgi:hypothetical protein
MTEKASKNDKHHKQLAIYYLPEVFYPAGVSFEIITEIITRKIRFQTKGASKNQPGFWRRPELSAGPLLNPVRSSTDHAGPSHRAASSLE